MRRSTGIALVLTALGTIATSPVRAEAEGLKLHPIPGLFGVDAASCGAGGPSETVIAPPLCEKLTPMERRQYWGQRFAVLVADRFGASRIQADLSAPPPVGMTRETLLARALVTSLHVSRADLWTVPRPSGVEVHMPLTLSLLMTNVVTGEVMFAHSTSIDVHGLMRVKTYEAEAAAQFDQQFDAALVRLVDEASARFQPGAVTAEVRARIGAAYVVDAGLKDGLREGDQIGSDARVVFADAHYAIVEPTLESLAVGQHLVRYVAQPVEALSRPSLLVVVADPPEDMPAGYLTVLMEEALSATGGFSLVSVNPASAAIREPQLTAANVRRRAPALPDFFLRVTAAPLAAIEGPTNVDGVDRRVQDARVYVEVINHEGRIVFAAEGKDQRIDEIVDGMAPSTAQRRDAAVRNAMLRAAQALKAGFSPAHLRLDVRSAEGDDVVVDDPGGALGLGLNARVLRSAGRVSGIEGEVFAPIAEVEVTGFGPGVATARQSGVESRRVRRGDQIAYETVGSLSRSRFNYAQCEAPGGRLAVDVRGAPQPLFQPIALNRLAATFPGAVHAADFPKEARRLALEAIADDYRHVDALKPLNPDVCFEPVHGLTTTGQRPSGKRFVQNVHDLVVGYILRRDGQRVGASGLKQELTATAIPANADAIHRDAALQIDLADAAAELATKAASQLSAPE